MPDWTPDQLNDRTTEDSVRDGAAPWLVALDTGGTFTDLVARDPRGTILRAKVPSDGSILATLLSVDRAPSACRARIRPAAGLVLPDGLLDGWRVEAHADEPTCVRSQRGEWIELSAPLAVEPGRPLRFVRSDAPIDAPRLGLHAITGTPLDRALPPIEIRLSTTRGTNALLEGRGARVGVLVSDGLTGVVEIGDQTREDIFARVPVRTRRVATAVRSLPERSLADGQVLHEANPESCAAAARALLGEGCETVVVSLAHALANDRESSIARELRARGVRAIAAREIAPHPRLLTRTETACVHAQIEPVLAAFVNDATCTAPDARSFAFTSAGVLQRAARLLARDTLYSGPAGGARAVATVARRHGFDRAVGFDMGGTSSDVSRCTGDGVALRGESRINRMTVAAPSVAIDSVAAGGGSICRMRDGALEVGPESAGANPGPACYGRGGPLTITDINLLAGRMAVGVGAMSLDPAPAEHALARISDELARTRPSSRDALLQALLDIADARMALAIEALCVRDGVDPRGHALIAFGGAGGQHACAIATRLGIAQVVFPRFAGFMCAQGVFAAEPARFATRTVLATLDNCAATLAGLAAEATAEATHALALDGFPAPERTRVRASLRLSGQEASIEVPFASADDMRARFMERFRALFGYEPPPRAIEVVSLEATAWAAAWAAAPAQAHAAGKSDATSSQDGAPTQSMLSEGERVDARSIARGSLREGDLVLGPAIITDAGETVVLDRGWRATVDGGGDLIASRTAPATARASDAEQELFAARLEAIALSMGNVLERTALSPNIRDRLDFSCAVLDAHGTLVQNAPHLPVHLGALGVCTRAVMSELDLAEGDIAVTNHPAFGGSHLPDVTTVAPVYAGGVRVAFVAVRAHHAEIGGTRPGSFPPDARSLAEEGIVLEPFLAVRGGTFDRVACRARFASGPHPSRNPDENLADLEAQVAATRYGVSQVAALARELSVGFGVRCEGELQRADRAAREALTAALSATSGSPHATAQATVHLDDGTPVHAAIARSDASADGRFAIRIASPLLRHPQNFNAPFAVTRAATLYALRLLIDRAVPMNEGLLRSIDLEVPCCMLNPAFERDPLACPPVVAGNVETSQSVVAALVAALGIAAESQSTMNNVLFGNSRFTIYETLGGGAGAGPACTGASAVHVHMSNTRLTDIDVLERRAPVVIRRFAIREGSGGAGRQRGGCGLVREYEFREGVSVSFFGSRRRTAPMGMLGASPGACGAQHAMLDGRTEPLEDSVLSLELAAGDRLTVETPGGGGWGA